jgi:hypothetical protein
MCDKCQTIFSELEVGWQTFTAVSMEEDDNGNPVERKQAMDACPSCALVPKRQFDRETRALASGESTEARIAKLERQTGLDPETGTFESVSA